ncbi:D-hexose-6-phosphate mutarotase [Acinetobacter sp. ANC 4640]
MHTIKKLELNQQLTDLDILEIDSPSCSACIALQGAQILQYQPKHRATPLLWLSQANTGQLGKALRGGIPLCFPWFGAHPQGLQPAHGFARNQIWELQNVSYDEAQAIHHVDFILQDSPETRKIWPHAFRLKLRISCGRSLNLDLHVENIGSQAFEFSFAWHSYFQVDQIRQTEIHGLQHAEFIDQLQNNRHFWETDTVTFQQETDRIYPKASGYYQIVQAHAEPIQIAAPSCASVVIWNPWQDKAERLGDIAEGDWQHFVCVECGQIASETVQLAAGSEVHYQLKITDL